MNTPIPTPEMIPIFIEIKKGSNHKYEYNKSSSKLELDRILCKPFVYPYAYGFIPNTIAEDNDELDVLVISDDYVLFSNDRVNAYIIGALLMDDEKGADPKILTVLKPDFERNNIQDISDISSNVLERIQSFFANYKINEPEKWSTVHGFVGREFATQIYQKSIQKYKSQAHISSTHEYKTTIGKED